MSIFFNLIIKYSLFFTPKTFITLEIASNKKIQPKLIFKRNSTPVEKSF